MPSPDEIETLRIEARQRRNLALTNTIPARVRLIVGGARTEVRNADTGEPLSTVLSVRIELGRAGAIAHVEFMWPLFGDVDRRSITVPYRLGTLDAESML